MKTNGTDVKQSDTEPRFVTFPGVGVDSGRCLVAFVRDGVDSARRLASSVEDRDVESARCCLASVGVDRARCFVLSSDEDCVDSARRLVSSVEDGVVSARSFVVVAVLVVAFCVRLWYPPSPVFT